MKSYLYIYFLGLILSISAGCKQAYMPPQKAVASNFLVVDGVINVNENDSTVIKLSRTVPLAGKVTFLPETGASVNVVNDQGISFFLTDWGNGKYVYYNPNGFTGTGLFHVVITTKDGKQYFSDPVAVKHNPPVDSIGFTPKGNYLQIYVNAHDPNNATRYYRWEYEETWRFHAKYSSDYVSNGVTGLVARGIGNQIYQCFGNNASTTIVLGSTAKLAQDIVYQNPVTEIPSNSEKIETRYSILVRQYALTGEEYNFWQNLKKNTEQLGSIFDPQPSSISGNIHCSTDPKEIVVGYIGATNVNSKRIYISNTEMPAGWFPQYPYDCKEDTIKNADVLNTLVYPPYSFLATHKWLGSNGLPIGYYFTTPECADCTLRGTTKQPYFWKE